MFVNEMAMSSDPSMTVTVDLYTSVDPTNMTSPQHNLTSATWTLLSHHIQYATYKAHIYSQIRSAKDAFSGQGITGPASLLPMTDNGNSSRHFLFFGGQGHISVTTSSQLTSWSDINYDAWLQPRSDAFDKDGVESGPQPVRLRDGNFLMLYNGYAAMQDQDQVLQLPLKKSKQYEIGWLILDGDDPATILQRCSTPIIRPTFNYETCMTPYTCTRNSSVYAKAIVPIDGAGDNDSNESSSFRVYFSASDT